MKNRFWLGIFIAAIPLQVLGLPIDVAFRIEPTLHQIQSLSDPAFHISITKEQVDLLSQNEIRTLKDLQDLSKGVSEGRTDNLEKMARLNAAGISADNLGRLNENLEALEPVIAELVREKRVSDQDYGEVLEERLKSVSEVSHALSSHKEKADDLAQELLWRQYLRVSSMTTEERTVYKNNLAAFKLKYLPIVRSERQKDFDKALAQVNRWISGTTIHQQFIEKLGKLSFQPQWRGGENVGEGAAISLKDGMAFISMPSKADSSQSREIALHKSSLEGNRQESAPKAPPKSLQDQMILEAKETYVSLENEVSADLEAAGDGGVLKTKFIAAGYKLRQLIDPAGSLKDSSFGASQQATRIDKRETIKTITNMFSEVSDHYPGSEIQGQKVKYVVGLLKLALEQEFVNRGPLAREINGREPGKRFAAGQSEQEHVFDKAATVYKLVSDDIVSVYMRMGVMTSDVMQAFDAVRAIVNRFKQEQVPELEQKMKEADKEFDYPFEEGVLNNLSKYADEIVRTLQPVVKEFLKTVEGKPFFSEREDLSALMMDFFKSVAEWDNRK